ncbi:MAG: hypothetical protein NVSMB10_00270 [Steroidobacteraceae bacterium]
MIDQATSATPQPPPADGSPRPENSIAADDGRRPALRRVREIGGRDGPDPTRFGDWELKGRCIDF